MRRFPVKLSPGRALVLLLSLALAIGASLLAGCGGGTKLLGAGPPPETPGSAAGSSGNTGSSSSSGTSSGSGSGNSAAVVAGSTIATKNTTRFGGADAIDDAAAVALGVFPSAAPGTHPTAVTLVPADNWQAALAASVLSAAPIRAPILISQASALPAASARAVQILAPTGAGSIGGAQVIRVGDAVGGSNLRIASISGTGPYALAAAIDRFSAAAHGGASPNVIIASGDDSAYAMPAAGLAAVEGEPILFVNSGGIPNATRQALLSHPHPRIYVLGPASVIPDSVLTQLKRYGTVKRIAAQDPVSNAVVFSEYRDPACAYGQPCAHVQGSFGWAMRSPGHGYVLINLHRPLDAAAAAPLSASGDYGPQLLLDDPSRLPRPVLDYFLNYATPGYTSEGPTAAVYNHGWLIGGTSAISASVQSQVDQLLEPVAQR